MAADHVWLIFWRIWWMFSYSTSLICQRWSIVWSNFFIFLATAYIWRHSALSSFSLLFSAFYCSYSWVSFRKLSLRKVLWLLSLFS